MYVTYKPWGEIRSMLEKSIFIGRGTATPKLNVDHNGKMLGKYSFLSRTVVDCNKLSSGISCYKSNVSTSLEKIKEYR